MVRTFALFLASLAAALGLASPAAAQSLGLVKMPVVFVRAPVVQGMHQGRTIVAPAPVMARTALAEPIAVQAYAAPSHSVGSVAVVAPGAQLRYASPIAPSASAPMAPGRGIGIDRAFRDYRRAIAHYGPFRVLDAQRVALVGETDGATPRHFRAMLRDFPGLAQIDMVDCPGTRDDLANMALGRMIRAAGIATHVPANGSVRSGAVELFFAGARRDIADGAEFAVHSWMDDAGREAGDFAEDAPENRKYLDYYREMGMSEREARAFYAFTNSVPHREARWLGAREMRRWAGRGPAAAPRIAYAAM